MVEKKRKYIPLMLMLLAGIIAWTLTFLFQYTLSSMLIILLLVLFVFYITGLIIVAVLDSFDKNKEDEETEKVIEKEMDHTVNEGDASPENKDQENK